MSDPLAPERLVPPTPGQLRRLMGAERLRPRKSLSQNFLTDPAALDAIVAAAELSPGDRVVEIGPGLGVLTRRLLAAGASVLAVELDPRLAEYLRRELDGVDRFELIEADALSLHPRELFPGEPIKVVANIPYHITSPLLHAFLEGERPPELTVLLVQPEVAERVAAPPGPDELPVGLRPERGDRRGRGPRAGRRLRAGARRRLGRARPAPPRRSPSSRSARRASRSTASCRPASGSGASRSTTAWPASCRSTGRASSEALAACGVDPERRPQTLSVDEWACLTGRLGAAAVTGALRLEAPAKLNLSLSVVGRRADGIHLLDSELVLLELADRLLLMPGCSGLRVEGEGADSLPLGAENLAWRGLRAGLGGEPELACLALEKRIPASAGLGGGSSDAAAAWRLGRRWRGLPDDADAARARGAGGDRRRRPVLRRARPAARVTGIGERIEPLPPERRHVVLAHPPFGLSTAAVFAELRPDEWGARSRTTCWRRPGACGPSSTTCSRP